MLIRLLQTFFLLFIMQLASPSFAFDFKSLFGKQTYDIYECSSRVYDSKECPRKLVATGTFDVIKDKSEVYINYTLLENQKKGLMPLDNCKVIDSKNWICGGKIEISHENGFTSTSIDIRYQMIDGQVETTSGTLDFYFPLKRSTSITTYYHGKKFVKK